MDKIDNKTESSEVIEEETSSSVDSLSESELDTSDSLGNLNIQAAVGKRSCSEGDLESDEEQMRKWRCIRDEDEKNSNAANNEIDDNSKNISVDLATNCAIPGFTSVCRRLLNGNRKNLDDSLAGKSDWPPYEGHLTINHVTSAEPLIGEDCQINSLPQMVMTRIFSSLPLFDLLKRACVVCRYWRNLAYDPVLWRNINLRLQPKVQDRCLLGLVRLSQNISSLDLTDSKLITNEGVMKILKHCRSLTALILVRLQQLDNDCISSIGVCCPNLKTLYLDSCYLVGNDALKKISEGCERLQELRLNHCSNISNPGIEYLSQPCHKLQILMLNQCHQVTDDCMEKLVTGCPKLETLLLMSCALTDAGIVKLAQLQNLKVLDVSNIGAVTSQGVNVIVESCEKLESLNLSLCRNINDDCVKYITRKANNLKYLYMVSCNVTDKALHHVADHSKTIVTLDVGWCQQVTIDGVIKVSTFCVKTLQNFGLMRCDKIEPPEMDRVVDQFPSITYSTMHLDCKRLIERALREGHLPSELEVK